MSKSKIDNDKYNPYISEIVNSDDINILIDKLITLLIKVQDESKNFSETKYFIKNCITISSQSIDDVLKWLKENQNKSKYVFLLGFFYHNKFSLEENNSEGFVFFLKAAEDSYPIAQVYLSRCYIKGFGTEISNNLAFNWIQKAAENESIIGQNILGCYYKDGINNLTIYYYNREGTEKNLKKAFYWYQKAAENEHISAQYNLALAYENGKGIEKNLEKAFYWYQKAAANGNEAAMCNLAMHYENGEGTEK